jgi:uncharacterized damage-inducible protein DinB
MPPDFIASWRTIFVSQKKLAEGALSQLSDDQLHQRLAPNLNSAAATVQHLAGNMLSRWTDWLATDGEKPTRHREAEFEDRRLPRADLMQLWERGWAAVFAALDALTPADLSRTVTIRGQPHSIPDAVNRQISHYGYHTGQLHFIARGLAGDQNWQWQTVAPGKTGEFNRTMSQQHPSFRPER